jgi:four helix bundle protein
MRRGAVAEEANPLTDRFLDFAASVVRLSQSLPRNVAGRHIAGQLLRAGTSAGANYEEACAAESRADFCQKLQIVLKELRECRFWLRLIMRSELLPATVCQPVLNEAQELCNIVGKSVVTAKRNA